FAFFDAPSAAAMTMMVIGVLGIVAAVQFLYLDKRTHYQ
ncbi:MAG: sugar ABC transporter permease, partial [Paracoccaceae bacterium]